MTSVRSAASGCKISFDIRTDVERHLERLQRLRWAEGLPRIGTPSNKRGRIQTWRAGDTGRRFAPAYRVRT
jgi:hypothetical protein